MTPETVFKLCSAVALVGWLLLIIGSQFVMEIDKFIIGIIITLLTIVYAWLIVSSFDPVDMKNFGSLDGVMKLFQSKSLITAGWVHYLAFDLMVGIWINRNSLKYGINQWLILPCMLFTFMLGPVGLLVYLLLRFLKTRNYFSASF